MASFERGQIVKYKGRPYVYFAKSMFIADKHMVAVHDPKCDKVRVTKVRARDIALHEQQNIIDSDLIKKVLATENEYLASQF